MSDPDDVVALLREIRDVQKAHFEQYRLFTTSVMETQQRHAAALEGVQARNAAARERQASSQSQTAEALARHRGTVVIGAVVQGLIIGAIAFAAVFAALRR